jgi:hypothetical protein
LAGPAASLTRVKLLNHGNIAITRRVFKQISSDWVWEETNA